METRLIVSPSVRNEELNELFSSAWLSRRDADMLPVLKQALFYVCAYSDKRLVGFARVLGDGGVHGFLLDPTVAPDMQRKGIGRQLVNKCADESRRRGIEWLHVDFEPHLKAFYESCGFKHTEAGLRNLKN
ncbi:MAG: GNAT family N-acetyltransferase [Dechloromonas sp.]|nr:MAG: GNAT family N-acetyltransferase [Dechloromonas sp.]